MWKVRVSLREEKLELRSELQARLTNVLKGDSVTEAGAVKRA